MIYGLVIVGFLLIFVCGEWLWQHRTLSQEHARKFIHIICGVYTVLLPFVISYYAIAIIALGFTVLMIAMHNRTILKVITTANRTTFGTMLMPLGIAVTAWLFPQYFVFSTAIAILTFADSAAALFGRQGGKSAQGSLMFFLVSVAVLVVASLLHGSMVSAHVITIALIATLIERYSYYGLDNFSVPLSTAFLITVLL